MATITKTPSRTWKAVIRKSGWPTTIKTFRTKRDAEDWARRTEDEMVRGVYIQRASSERLTVEAALKRYLAEISPTKRPTSVKDVLECEIRLLSASLNINNSYPMKGTGESWPVLFFLVFNLQAAATAAPFNIRTCISTMSYTTM